MDEPSSLGSSVTWLSPVSRSPHCVSPIVFLELEGVHRVLLREYKHLFPRVGWMALWIRAVLQEPTLEWHVLKRTSLSLDGEQFLSEELWHFRSEGASALVEEWPRPAVQWRQESDGATLRKNESKIWWS